MNGPEMQAMEATVRMESEAAHSLERGCIRNINTPACEVDSQHACREVVSPLHHLRLMRIISSAFWHYIRKSLIVNNCSEAVRWYIYMS